MPPYDAADRRDAAAVDARHVDHVVRKVERVEAVPLAQQRHQHAAGPLQALTKDLAGVQTTAQSGASAGGPVSERHGCGAAALPRAPYRVLGARSFRSGMQ